MKRINFEIIILFQAALCFVIASSVGEVQHPAHDEKSTSNHHHDHDDTKHGIAEHDPQSSTNDDHELPPYLGGYEHYRSFIDQLSQYNVDEYIDLPMIAVMGDTSSGKSSLLSMISQVELPSKATLTTRCPIMLQMRKSHRNSYRHDSSGTTSDDDDDDDNYQATVKVIWKDRPTNNGRFWRSEEDGFAPRTVNRSNWGDLTQLIADAQTFILAKQEKDVARDVIQVEMKCPHCEDLTLIDLPGMVRSHGKDESDTLGEEIQALLNDYLHNSRCVILAVLPANVDFHNSQILAEAQKVDHETKRTIPVLTKPDLIDYGAEGNVKELLLGEKTQKFEMGFHMVKGRGQDALNRNVTITEALHQEETFFRLTEPWSKVDDNTLFGTQNLRTKLGELQMRLIRSSFESIIAEIKAEREAALQARARLGVVPTDLGQKIVLFRTIKDDYYHNIGPLMLGGGGGNNKRNSGSTDLSTQRKPSADFLLASKDFMVELDGSRLSTIADISIGTTVVALVNGQEIKDRVCNIRGDQVFLERMISSSRNTYIPMLDPTSSLSGSFRGTCDDENTLLRYKSIHKNLVRRDSTWIQKIIEDRRPYKLPVFASTDAFEEIVFRLLEEDWRPPTMDLLEKTSKLMKKTANEYVASITAIESLSEFRGYLQLISIETVDKLTEEAKVKIDDFIKREQTPYTQDEDLIRNLNKLRTKRLKDEIVTMMDVDMVMSLWEDSDSSERIARRLHEMVTDVFDRNNARELDDHMAEEMQHILNAYGKIARKRLIDGIPMICVEIMQEFPQRINQALSQVSDDVIDAIIVPQPEKIRAMVEYDRKIDAFSNGIAAIRTMY
ncbi:unnamed protein product [Cylindrotheca closterium]|uniref:Dynamin-type G domain-containing protein n=1 Tax=Cylindrotheca closterium TaxID=2856 RepID=A0AAD2G9L2_9STRA|nr:unnamed protein product [Cylindrotheca closterium]